MSVVVQDDSIQIDRLTLGPYETNSYVLMCRHTAESVLVDAPGGADKVIHQLKRTNPRYILITHAHMDHTGALSELKKRLGVPVSAHTLEAKRLPLKPEILLEDGDRISFGKMELTVLHTPGHTPGSVCFLTGKYLIAGDTIFPAGPGKT